MSRTESKARPSGERSYSSAALLDATTVFVTVPAEPIRYHLARRGLGLRPLPGAGRKTHVIWIDLGRVIGGAARAGGIDQHTWWTRTGEALGGTWGWASAVALGTGLVAAREAARMARIGSQSGLLGSAASAAFGWWSGAAAGAAAFAAPGAKAGGSLAADWARELSLGASRVLGTYLETIVAIPNVVANGSRRGPYLYVLGMHTNGPVAVWGDRTLGYGYGKRLLELSARDFELYEVREARRSLLTAEIEAPSNASWSRPAELAGLEQALALLSQPLLGQIDAARFAVSRLERLYPPDAECVSPARGRLRLATTFDGFLLDGEFSVEALSSKRATGAFFSRNVVTRVTYPEHVRRSEL